ncbi:S9 family peptidase [Lujinxingia vulgaris]|uniref:S9 family peptidase n=1 Tax=Lujinxingia vulgaris TaxID=2600176 RepID=A0A5C6X9Y3_9DELT|nr:S9 family peptidase [Lujinxingia vulgaris]TXD33979.1 S9 family peptidase [Lujinxingia vulgaris]
MSESTQKQVPFGLWSSKLGPEMLAGELRFLDVSWGGKGRTLVWAERVDGRGVLMVQRPDQAARALNDELSVSGGVGYGGGEFDVRDDLVVFAASDGRLYAADLDKGRPRPLSPEWGKVASPAISPDGAWVAYVHRVNDEDVVAVVPTDGSQWPVKVAEGADFYMQPAWSPEGDRLVWVSWDHPQMPWTQTRVESAGIDMTGGVVRVGPRATVVGQEGVAVQQPQYSPDGRWLAYLSDATGHWQVVLRDVESGESQVIAREGVEFGGPPWIQGLRFYDWTQDSEAVIALGSVRGEHHLERLGVDGSARRLPGLEGYTSLAQPRVTTGGAVALIASSSKRPPRVITVAAGSVQVRRFASSERLQEDELAAARAVSWPVRGEDDEEVEVHGIFYPPTNPTYSASGKPPVLVMIHGGPTAQRVMGWEARNQFFATRGFAVLDVNYRGSTGYGRAYMEALFGKWGEADVEDAVAAVRYLEDEGLADGQRAVIMGGSAGGYTVLKALVDHPGTFKAGVCLYGISDLFALQRGTHKFEAHYNDSLIGPLPEAAELYRERSPINRAERISDALAIFHGAKDSVVPLDQAEAIAGSLRRRGVPHLYHVYEEEGHGWRRAQTIDHFHRKVLEFLVEKVVY